MIQVQRSTYTPDDFNAITAEVMNQRAKDKDQFGAFCKELMGNEVVRGFDDFEKVASIINKKIITGDIKLGDAKDMMKAFVEKGQITISDTASPNDRTYHVVSQVDRDAGFHAKSVTARTKSSFDSLENSEINRKTESSEDDLKRLEELSEKDKEMKEAERKEQEIKLKQNTIGRAI